MQLPTPIVIDLDDTLAKTDFFYESLLKFIKLNPLNFFRAVFWLFSKNKAYLKSQIAKVITLDPSLIPYNEKVIDYIKSKKQQHHPIILATATHRVFAHSVAAHLGLFDQVFATDDGENLKGSNKQRKLVEQFGERGFVYVGDSRADLKVWRSAKAAVVVSTSDKLIRQVQSITQIEKSIDDCREKPSISQILYFRHWPKNLPIFLPLFLFGHTHDTLNWMNMFIAFISLCLCASATHIFTELFNLDVLRQNKAGNTVFALAQLNIIQGIVLALVCLITSICLGLVLSLSFATIMLIYFVFSVAHAIYLSSVIPQTGIYFFQLLLQFLAGYLVIAMK